MLKSSWRNLMSIRYHPKDWVIAVEEITHNAHGVALRVPIPKNKVGKVVNAWRCKCGTINHIVEFDLGFTIMTPVVEENQIALCAPQVNQ